MAKKAAPKKEETAGRGKKKCVCGAVLGVRVKVCPECDHEFSFQTKDKPAAKSFKMGDNKLQNTLLAEKAKVEESLANRENLENRLRCIDKLLDTL